MVHLKREDLQFNYKWTASAGLDNPSIRGGNDHAELNRSEGYEVLGFLNALADEFDLGAEELLDIERRLHDTETYVGKARKIIEIKSLLHLDGALPLLPD